ncbi:uncharacterized protein A1O9_04027 [Exophiala aquamarina CBS 119918]|uniref:Zn(2)-C6 fungal-type domain-containing protein n=1 Tax=Exophiala aquamarina CBS 119918 TaxID=1182545 RepID=A0A072PIP2_9EURO|nr:uncharacterized protein A1O9_04027 [Exophiala aquamarina CBS 119918]KEF59183.1 hypothetical protein A1O9_04027 [Exophiala aquamarina CBS 119918]
MVGNAVGKRVRTGCMTCRGRRRKCDEQRPKCANCVAKGLPCQYGGKLTFVASKYQNQPGDATTRARGLDPATPSGNTKDASPFLESIELSFHPDIPIVGPNDFFQPVIAGIELTSESQKLSDQIFNIPQQQKEGYSHPSPSDTRNLRRKLYELELLTYYRYDVAPVLDLGLGSLCFGIGLLLESKTSEAVYHAVLAVASCQRAAKKSSSTQVDQATSITSAHLARDDSKTRHGRFVAPSDLLLWMNVCSSPVEQWSTLSSLILGHARSGIGSLERWLLLSRLHCGTKLVALSRSSHTESLPPPPQNTADEKSHPALTQLGESLWLLETTFSLLLSDVRPSELPTAPTTQNWCAQWHKVQKWYLTRNDEMRQIFEVANEGDLQPQENAEFPHIVFSNSCAIVANVAHHVTSLLLLQSKPRLTKPVTRSISSSSSLWHVHRAIGIIATATGGGTWDPFTTAALLYCSWKLSSSKQIRSVANTMNQIQSSSGLKLENPLSDLDRLARSR